jgi:hypothetical protein
MSHSGEKCGHPQVDSLQVMDMIKGLQEGCLVHVAARHDELVVLLKGLKCYASGFIFNKGMSLFIQCMDSLAHA